MAALRIVTVHVTVYGVVTRPPSQHAQSIFGVGRPERPDLQPVEPLAARRWLQAPGQVFLSFSPPTFPAE